MTSTWDEHRGHPNRIRRIRGGGESEPPPRARAPVTPLQLIETRPHVEEGFEIGRSGVDIDGLFALALFLPMLFIGQLTTLGAGLIAAIVPLYLFIRRDGLLPAFGPRSFLLLMPLLAIASALWSTAPMESARYGAELAMVVMAGMLLSSARNQEAVLRGLTLAFLIYVISALFFGRYINIGVGAGGTAFSGLTESKNLLGDIASTGLVASAVVAMMAMERRRWVWIVLGLTAVGLDVYCVMGARSAGALLGLAIAVAAVATLAPLIYAGRVVRAWLTATIGVCLVAIGANYRPLAQAMIEIGANLFDKDPTLTGRTYLWYRAADLISERPVLGRGYYAFWLQGNIDAEGLWRYFGIDGRGGFSFHNTFVEILVMLGWVGLVLAGATVLIGVAFLIRQFVARPTLPLVFWIGILLYELARTPIETVGVAPLYFSTALLFGALGAAFAKVRTPNLERAAWRTPASEQPNVRPIRSRSPHPEPGFLRLVPPPSKEHP